MNFADFHAIWRFHAERYGSYEERRERMWLIAGILRGVWFLRSFLLVDESQGEGRRVGNLLERR